MIKQCTFSTHSRQGTPLNLEAALDQRLHLNARRLMHRDLVVTLVPPGQGTPVLEATSDQGVACDLSVYSTVYTTVLETGQHSHALRSFFCTISKSGNFCFGSRM